MIINYRNGPKHHETKRVGEIMLDYSYKTGSESIRQYGEDMMGCGSFPIPQWAKKSDGSYAGRIVYNSCKRRGCPPCEARKNLPYQEFLTKVLKNKGTENFYFLTVTHGGGVSSKDLKLVTCEMGKKLSKLFRRKSTAFVVGGFRSFESNYNQEKDTFNPHFHILIEVTGEDLSKDKNILRFLLSRDFDKALSSFLAQPKNRHRTKEKVLKTIFSHLKKGQLYQVLWSALLQSVGLGAVCDIKAVSNKKDGEDSMGLELCKYLTKTMKIEGERLGQFLVAMKGKRLFSSWGTLKKVGNLFKEEVIEESEKAEPIQLDYKGDGRTLKQVVFDADLFSSPKDLLIRRLALKNNLITYEISDSVPFFEIPFSVLTFSPVMRL